MIATFLSTNPERHAFVIGVYEGFKDFKDWNGIPSRVLQNPDVSEEPHYAKGGYLLGTLLRLMCYALLFTQVQKVL